MIVLSIASYTSTRQTNLIRLVKIDKTHPLSTWTLVLGINTPLNTVESVSSETFFLLLFFCWYNSNTVPQPFWDHFYCRTNLQLNMTSPIQRRSVLCVLVMQNRSGCCFYHILQTEWDFRSLQPTDRSATMTDAEVLIRQRFLPFKKRISLKQRSSVHASIKISRCFLCLNGKYALLLGRLLQIQLWHGSACSELMCVFVCR